ncbi:MAG: hypothetical protein M1818_005807 [Claussenomyces sp. TS43310]|nr:MAG: hypothetical protein M1818_005807 [Claussenomyces sp. TS43310]
MHAIAWGALRTAHRSSIRQSCRVIAGVRHPLPTRPFHRSAALCRTPDDPTETNEDGADSHKGGEQEGKRSDVNGEAADDVDVAQDLAAPAQRGRSRADYGSAARRAVRNRKPKEVPPLVLPDWFWERNVRCFGPADTSERELPIRAGADAVSDAVQRGDGVSAGSSSDTDGLLTISESTESDEDEIKRGMAELEKIISTHDLPGEAEALLEALQKFASQRNLIVRSDNPEPEAPRPLKEPKSIPLGQGRYTINRNVFQEVLASFRAGLALRPPPNLDAKDIIRPDTLLQCPREEAAGFLDALVERAALQLEADIVRLNSEDVAQIVGNYIGENIGWTSCDTALLGYESHKVSGKLETYEDPLEEDEEVDVEDDESMSSFNQPSSKTDFSGEPEETPRPKGVLMRLFTGRPMNLEDFLAGSKTPNTRSLTPSPAVENWSDFKLTAALEAIVDAADDKRVRETISDKKSKAEAAPPAKRDLVIQINEYREMSKTTAGRSVLSKLRDVVKSRWIEGRNIIVVGTTTAEDPVPALTRDAIRRLQSDVSFGDQRTIFVPPERTDAQDFILETDEKLYVRKVNIRHLEDLISKLSGDNQEIHVNLEKDFPKVGQLSQDVEEAVWAYPKIHRIAVSMLGLLGHTPICEGTRLEGPQLEYAFRMLSRSDRYKFKWAAEEREKQKQLDEKEAGLDAEKQEGKSDANSASKEKSAEKLKRIRKSCTSHEKKLIGGVVQPDEIRTTFSDVRAPPETIEALKTLTSLSLIRPEAFSYGVLATDKIPGVLLYGPPGTGKTLLAKAVAKESGATVLEVSGSEIFDMYVGEGEKNIKALFSLAKKLSPCVVFIDEADAIFGARSSSPKRTSHREVINQFLREWDGMNELSAFIMVATNRPFDLDEAVLRRLPRRLLVDLPTEADRVEILKIHLKGEVLHDSVSIEDLAKNTPFYSGSDLKNLCVAAALACVREENAEAAAAAAQAAASSQPVSSTTKPESSSPASTDTADPAAATPLPLTYTYPSRRTLTKSHFDTALQEISASISEDMATLSAIRKFDERYGDRKGRRKRASRMGFAVERGKEEEMMREREEEGRVRRRREG